MSSSVTQELQSDPDALRPHPPAWRETRIVPVGVAAPATPVRDVVRQFTPNWFTVTMGTGILALALNQAPFATAPLRALAEGLWIINIGLFSLFSILYAVRWLLFPQEARRIFGHPVMPMFFGAVPMGLATIVNGFLVFGVPRWGETAVLVAETLWWVDAAMAFVCGLGVPFLMFTRQDHSLEKMTAVWLLPIVAAGVSASSAGLLVPYLADPQAALRTLVLGYALWATSLPLATGIIVILVLRLAMHKVPHKDMAASGWLPLGPIGTGALGLMLLGGDGPQVFAAAGIPGIGDIAAGIGVIGGAALWGYGLWWLGMATLTTARYIGERMPFNLGWWAFTFPLGIYSVASLTLARQTHLAFLTDIGGLLVACLGVVWVLVAARTLHGAWHRYLFVAPYLVRGATPDERRSDGA
jgi:C4-dicarboxylate transporter/malic acid transport protein